MSDTQVQDGPVPLGGQPIMPTPTDTTVSDQATVAAEVATVIAALQASYDRLATNSQAKGVRSNLAFYIGHLNRAIK